MGRGPGISTRRARLFAQRATREAVTARNPDKPVLLALALRHGVRRDACDATNPGAIASLFQQLTGDLGQPTLRLHNIDGRVPGTLRRCTVNAEPGFAVEALRNATFSAFLVGRQAARHLRQNPPKANDRWPMADGRWPMANRARGTIIVKHDSVPIDGDPFNGAVAMACHAKTGLAQRTARALCPQSIYGADVPIDAALGWIQHDGSRAHGLPGTTVDDNMADPEPTALNCQQRHRQPRLIRAFEVVLRAWVEKG